MGPFKKAKSVSVDYNAHLKEFRPQIPRKLGMPPTPNYSGTVILSFAEVVEQIPSFSALGRMTVQPDSLAQIYDTLRNSVVVPKTPWPPTPVRFNHMVAFPNRGMYYVFYPL